MCFPNRFVLYMLTKRPHRFHKALNLSVRLWPIRCGLVMNDGVFTEIVLISFDLNGGPLSLMIFRG